MDVFAQMLVKMPRTRFQVALLFSLCFLAALGLRLHNLDRSSFWDDEIYQVQCTSGPVSQIWQCAPLNKPPLDYYLQALFVRAVPDEFHARLHACLLGAALVPALGALAWTMGGAGLALMVMALSFSLPLLVRYAQEGRPYTLMLLSGTLFLAIFWKTLKLILSGRQERLPRWLALLAAAMILCMWSMYFSLLLCLLSLLFAAAWISLSRDRRRAARRAFSGRRVQLTALASALAVLAAFGPLALRMHGAMAEQYDSFGGLWEKIETFLNVFAWGYDWDKRLAGSGRWLLGLLVLGWLGWAIRYRGTMRALAAHLGAFLFGSCFLSIFFFYRAIDHWMEVRYVLISLPPVLMLAAMGLETAAHLAGRALAWLGLIQGSPRRVARGLAALACLSLAAGMTAYVVRQPIQRTDWRELARRFKAKKIARPFLVVGDYQDQRMIRYYFNRHGIQAEILDSRFTFSVLERAIIKKDNVWFVYRLKAPKAKAFRKAAEPLPLIEEKPQIYGLYVRREPAPGEYVARLEPARPDCPGLVAGWGPLQVRPDAGPVRTVTANRAELIVDLASKGAIRKLALTAALHAQPTSATLARKVRLRINDHTQAERPLHDGWNLAFWTIEKKRLQKRENRIEFIFNADGDATGTLGFKEIQFVPVK